MLVKEYPTPTPADVLILSHADFVNATHSTKWVEEKLDFSDIAAPAKPEPAGDDDAEAARVLREVDVEVNGKRFVVKAWVPDVAVVATAKAKAKPRPAAGAGAAAGLGTGQVALPMPGTILKGLG